MRKFETIYKGIEIYSRVEYSGRKPWQVQAWPYISPSIENAKEFIDSLY